jgi:hypothetical protein
MIATPGMSAEPVWERGWAMRTGFHAGIAKVPARLITALNLRTTKRMKGGVGDEALLLL